jgi:ABC-2 type transport system permease protein
VRTAAITLELFASALRGRMQYRANFLTMVVFGLVYQLTGFVFIWVLLSRFQAVGGWTLGEVAFLYGLRLVVHGLHMVLFGGIGQARWLIRQGHFDRYLVRPVGPLLQSMSINLPANGFGDLLGGIVLFAIAATMVDVDWSPQAFAYLVMAIVGGALLEGALQVLVAALTFRFLETGNFSFFLFSFFDGFGNYPLSIFNAPLQLLLTWGVPVAFVAYFPASVLLARTGELSVQPWVAYAAPLAGVAWFALAYWMWRRGLRGYKSAGH